MRTRLIRPTAEAILILIFFISLVSIPCVSITRYANSLITEKIHSSNEIFLQTASSSLDSTIQSAVDQISVLTQTNFADYYTLLNASSITGSDITISAYHLYNALRGCHFSPAYFDDMFLYFRKSGLVLTPSGSYDAPTFFQKKMLFTEYSEDYFDSLMDMHFVSRICPSTSIWTQDMHGAENIFYDSAIPIAIHPSGSSRTDALLVLLINESTLQETFSSLNPNRSCHLYLMDTLSGSILNNAADTDYASVLNLSGQKYTGNSGTLIQRANSEKYQLLWINSSVSKLRYVCVEPELMITNQLHTFLIFTCLITITAIVLLVLLYYLITSRLKHGVASVFNRLNETSGLNQTIAPPRGIDFLSLKDAVDLLCTQYERNQPRLILSFLSQLLQNIPGKEEIKEFCENFDAFKPDSVFCILVLRTNFPAGPSAPDVARRFKILAALQKQLSEYGYVISLHDQQDNILFLTASDAEKLQGRLKRLGQNWSQITSALPEFTCGQSEFFSDIQDTYRNYHQVLTLLDYYGIRTLKSFYQMEDMMNVSDKRFLPEEKKKILNLAKHSPSTCQTYVEELLSGRKQQNISFCQYKNIILELLFLLEQILYEANIPFSVVFPDIGKNHENLISDAESLLSPIHLESLCLSRYHKLACLEPGLHDSLDQARQTLLQYIDDHLADINLTVLSEITGMNQNYLSQYFKKNFGITFLDYVTGKKIEKAKDLLINSTLTCKAIGESLGYHDSNVFIRTFKKMESITPNEYRKLHRTYS